MIRTSDSIVNLAAALVKAQSQLHNAPKETKGQVGNQVRWYTDLPTLTDLVRPVLAANELAYVQFPCNTLAGHMGLCTRLLHASGEWLEDEYSMPAGQGAQGAGSALTYMKRYALMAVLGIAADDDDGAAASQPARKTRTAPPAPAPPTDGTPPTNGPTEAQIKRMAATFNEIGIRERADRLSFIAAAARPVDSSKDLTRAEAATVIDTLERVRTGELEFALAGGEMAILPAGDGMFAGQQ